jgi:formylglycine-generating enzyme required for sulfatase activity
MVNVVCRQCFVQWSASGFLFLSLALCLGCRPSEQVKPSQEPAKQVNPEAPKSPVDSSIKEMPAVDTPVKELAPAKPATKPTQEPAEKPVEEPGKAPAKTSAVVAPVAEKVASQAAPATADAATLEPAVKWMPKPIENAAAEAKDQAGMKRYTEKLVNTDVKFDMAPIPGGTFKMGSPASEKNRKPDEGPQVEVKVEPFWMGAHEVTWEEYELWGLGLDQQRRKAKKVQNTDWDKSADALAIPTKPYADMTFGMGKEGFPAVCMTQFAAKMYCKWLSAKTGRYYRLPTEAEWEYACRAGTTTAYSFGNSPKNLKDYAWFTDNADEKYHKVAQKKPNPWGLYDMHGNVCEWCLDQYIADRYKQLGAKLVVDPVTPVTKTYPQVVRGGAWTDEAPLCRSAARRGSSKDWKAQDPQIPQSIWYHTDADFVGFRVVRPLRTPTAEEAARYEITDFEKQEYLDYKKAQAGKQ